MSLNLGIQASPDQTSAVAMQCISFLFDWISLEDLAPFAPLPCERLSAGIKELAWQHPKLGSTSG